MTSSQFAYISWHDGRMLRKTLQHQAVHRGYRQVASNGIERAEALYDRCWNLDVSVLPS